MTKGQISIEYLAVVGLSLLMIIPLLVIFSLQTISYQEDIGAAQLERAGSDLISAAEEVFYLGPPSQKELRLYFPPHIESITLESQAIVLNMTFSSTHISYVASSNLPLDLTGSLSTFEGPHTIIVRANEENITMSDS